MTLYGNTCPTCCGDMDDLAYLRTGASVCLFCGCNAEASASTLSRARRPDAMALGVSAAAMTDPAKTQAPPGWVSPLHDIQIQTNAGAARTELTTR